METILWIVASIFISGVVTGVWGTRKFFKWLDTCELGK
jgi:hypothetical protein